MGKYQIKLLYIKEGLPLQYKVFNRKSEKRARDVFYDLSVWFDTYAVSLFDPEGNLIDFKSRY